MIRHDERLASIHPRLADVVRRAAKCTKFEEKPDAPD